MVLADFAAFAALVSPDFDGFPVTEETAEEIEFCQVVIDEQTPLAHVSVVDAVVVVVEVVLPEEPQPAANAAISAAVITGPKQAATLCFQLTVNLQLVSTPLSFAPE